MRPTASRPIAFAAFLALASGPLVLGCAPRRASLPSDPASGTPPTALTTPLTPDQRRWVERTLSSLTLRDRVAQMVIVWMLGDYANSRDPAYAEVIRWVEDDRIGGVSMSLGTPMEVATKLNDLQRRARVPLIVSADL